MIFMGVPVPVDSMSIAMQPTIILFVKHTRNYWIFPHIHFAPYRHDWWGRWFPPRPRRRLRTRHTESQEETFAWCLRSLPQTKEYELITSANNSTDPLCSKMYNSSSFSLITLWLRLLAGDSAVKPGNVCSHCQVFKIQCTHNAPRPPKASRIPSTCLHPSTCFVEKGSPGSVWLLPFTKSFYLLIIL